MESPFDLKAPWIQNSYGLDRRLIKAISKLGFLYPTLVQAQTVPLALEGKDILVRARTGSGKTLAFAIPLLQKILQSKEAGESKGIQGIILAPTKELIKQISKNINDLLYYCRDSITLCTIADDNVNLLDYKMRALPDIVLATPAKLMVALKDMDLSSVSTFILDEADLVLSYGYKDDIHKITARMPKIFQGILVSATLSSELDKFKRLLLHKPVILKLEEAQSVANLMQFYLEASEEDKYLVLYVFLKLGILQGKGLIFVNTVSKCYKLKLFLQQFFISAAVLNAEIPLNSRTHILDVSHTLPLVPRTPPDPLRQEFNRGVFDYLIATDASVDTGEEDDSDEEMEQAEQPAEQDSDDASSDAEDDLSLPSQESDGEEAEDVETPTPAKAHKPKSKEAIKSSEEEYGVSRGIDFQAVNFVVNFDFPITAAAYIHRIGRTARGMSAAGATNAGLALSFVLNPDAVTSAKGKEEAMQELELLADIQSRQPHVGTQMENDHVLASLHNASDDLQADNEGSQPAPLAFNRQELESFRYRVQDVYRSVTGVAVRELRAAEIKRELLHSEKLQTYFQENPDDLKVLRHDKAILHPIRQKDHLKFVPDYLIPQSMRTLQVQTAGKHNKRNRRSNLKRKAAAQPSSRSKDPLFNADALDTQNDGADDDEGDDDGEDGEEGEDDRNKNSLSGRKRWKMNHKKGNFNPHQKKKMEHRTTGTFVTSRKH